MLKDVGKRKQGGGEEFLMRKEDDHRGIVEDGTTTTVGYLCNQGHVSVLDTTTVATTRNQRRYYRVTPVTV